MDARGVVLAGGQGTRLGELTRVVNKHLLPVGAEPMIYHPLRKLIGAGIRDILLVSGPEHLGDFTRQLGSGRRLGCSLTYCAQDEPGGIPQALSLGDGFCMGRRCVVLLGDNLFEEPLDSLMRLDGGADEALIVLQRVADPSRFGVADLKRGRIAGLEEKPARPGKGAHAVAGIYSFPADVFDVIRTQSPSTRGELEIIDTIKHYHERGRLRFSMLAGFWIDAGTPAALTEANRLVFERPPRWE